MSLDAIRNLRRSGVKPSRAVYVVIGDTSALLDEATSVVVRATDRPQAMDWGALVGLPVTVFTMQPLPHLTIAVLDALRDIGAKVFGAADSSGVYPLLMDADESHEALLRRAWELLCAN